MRLKYSLLNNLALNPADSKLQMKKKCPTACNKSYRSWSESSARFGYIVSEGKPPKT